MAIALQRNPTAAVVVCWTGLATGSSFHDPEGIGIHSIDCSGPARVSIA
jgi:hypothetical protein